MSPNLAKHNGKDNKSNEVIKEVLKESKKLLTAEQELRKENYQLKVTIAQLQVQLNDRNSRLLNIQLQQEKALLDKELGSENIS